MTKHDNGLKKLKASLEDRLDNIELEVEYEYSDVDLIGNEYRTLKVFEHKCKGHQNKAYHQLRKHQKYFVPKYIQEHPEQEINKVQYFYSNPKGIKLRFEEYIK